MQANEVIERLKKGNSRFVQDQLERNNQDNQRKKDLTSGQSPFAIILSCADSRVVPELAFDTGLGELFVCRVAGNIANTDTVASIEYAVANCGSKAIVVLGHQSCGAVTAAVKGGDNGYNLNHLLSQITPAVAGTSSDDINEVVKQNAKNVGMDLVNRSSIIAQAVQSGDVKIVPAYYSLENGSVEFFE